MKKDLQPRVPHSHFLVLGLYFLQEAIFFCMLGFLLFGQEGSETPVFKILVRAMHRKCDSFHLVYIDILG